MGERQHTIPDHRFGSGRLQPPIEEKATDEEAAPEDEPLVEATRIPATGREFFRRQAGTETAATEHERTVVRRDWPKILDKVSDILIASDESLSGSAILRALGPDGPDLAPVLSAMDRDHRFIRDEKKRWSLTANPAETVVQEVPTARVEKGGMVRPAFDAEHTNRWRKEVGPDKRRIGDERVNTFNYLD